MPKRPPLTPDSFLQHLFSPKKHGLPTGLRARKLVATPGRNKGRVAAYNRMSALSQETLKRSGLREAYLKGEAKLTEAKAQLRIEAVGKGFAKPVRSKKTTGGKTPVSNRRAALDAFIASHVARQIIDAGKGDRLNFGHLAGNVGMLPDDMVSKVTKFDYADIKRYGHEDDNLVMYPDGVMRNPLWYH